VADKSEFVDMIGEATRQSRRRVKPNVVDLMPASKEVSRLSRWPPGSWKEWRLQTLMPWRIKPWGKDRD